MSLPHPSYNPFPPLLVQARLVWMPIMRPIIADSWVGVSNQEEGGQEVAQRGDQWG